MHQDSEQTRTRNTQPSGSWQRPAFEVISLACEISAYAPDEGQPLF
jgi:hypothetical protein